MQQLTLDLGPMVPRPAGGLKYGLVVRQHHRDLNTTLTTYDLPDVEGHALAGSITEWADGQLTVNVNCGWRVTSRTSGSSNSARIDLGKVSYAAAEQRLADEARAARQDPMLLWDHRCTAAAIKIAKANGWWEAERAAA
jgi:hypothetical protein